MAVFTPRLVLVCALPAVLTLLTVLWTRQRRKSVTGNRTTSKPSPATEEIEAPVDRKSADLYTVSSPTQSRNEAEKSQEVDLKDKQIPEDYNLNASVLSDNETRQEVLLATETEVGCVNHRSVSEILVEQSEQLLVDALQEYLTTTDNKVNERLQESREEDCPVEGLLKVQETLPKMHVKSEENRLAAKLDRDDQLSPQGGSTSDLSDRQNSPVNSEASYCNVHEDVKPRRKRSSCRLSEESRDSAMGGEEESTLSDGPVCALLESTPSGSFSDSRTDLQKELLLPELQQPVNGESGCYNDLDEVLESPPPSIYSDGHSEGSCDSGKGGSDIQVISGSDLSQLSENALLVYEFELAQELCGRLIGRLGKHVNFIKSSSNANVFIKRHPFNARLKLCAVQGTKSEIKNALELIRKRFPVNQYPALSLVQVNIPLTCGVMVPETLQLHLPEGVTCDVILSSMVSAGHFFVQQPTHPTYPSLNRLDTCMTSCYSQMDTPQLPQPVEVGVICACPVMEGWFRAQVVNLYENSEECDVRFVDYGGYSCVPMSRLRQIRSDFMTLPFQASECYLANVKPASEAWSLEACATFEELAQGQILQSLVVGHAEDGIPYVHLYRVQGVSTVFINRELVNRSVAQWLEAEM